MATLSVKEVLVRALCRIRNPDDWRQGNGTDDWTPGDCGGDCAFTATWEKGQNRVPQNVVSAQSLIRQAAGMPDDDAFYLWHDARERKHPEVIAVIEKAILLSEKQSGVG